MSCAACHFEYGLAKVRMGAAQYLVLGVVGRREKFVVGNLESVRDFTDVRDVVRAYRLLLEKGEVGRIYAIGSNYRLKIGKLLRLVAEQVGVSPAAEVDPKLWRPTDASKKLDVSTMAELGWNAEIPIEKTLRDMAL